MLRQPMAQAFVLLLCRSDLLREFSWSRALRRLSHRYSRPSSSSSAKTLGTAINVITTLVVSPAADGCEGGGCGGGVGGEKRCGEKHQAELLSTNSTCKRE